MHKNKRKVKYIFEGEPENSMKEEVKEKIVNNGSKDK